CFSFYPGKNLGAFGEGGAAVTNDGQIAERMRLLRDWGQETKYNHVLAGYNYRMDGIQAAVLNVKLGYIEAWTEARRSIAGHYGRCQSMQKCDRSRSRKSWTRWRMPRCERQRNQRG